MGASRGVGCCSLPLRRSTARFFYSKVYSMGRPCRWRRWTTMVVWPHRRATISFPEAYHMPAPFSAASPSSKTLQRSHLAATMAVPRPVNSRTGLQQSLQVFCAVDRTTAPTPRHAPTVGAYSTLQHLQHLQPLQRLQVYSAYSLQQTYSTPLVVSVFQRGGL